MANDFSKEERVAFDDVLEAFNDELAMSRLVKIYKTPQTQMARSGDVIWRPKPYVMPSFDGLDQSSNFTARTQLSVPSSIDINKSAPFLLSPTELRDQLQEKRLGEGARQKLASDINRSVLDAVALQGSLFVKRSAASVGFDDVAQVAALLNETGVPLANRRLCYNTRDYLGAANDLAKASRSLDNEHSVKALRESYLGRLASLDTYQLDYSSRKVAAAGGGALTLSTLAAGVNVYVPAARSNAATGQGSNLDNRFQTVTVSSNASVVAGDFFTIANVFAVHPITKVSTGVLKTFKVVSIPVIGGTTMVITPPMITAQGGSIAEVQYQNCVVETASATAAIVFLNTVTAQQNHFFVEGCIEILPGKLEIPTDSGLSVLRGSTDQGIELVMCKQSGIDALNTKYRFDAFWGVVVLDTEMCGSMMFSQT
jgi:hypothetical protein